MLQPGNILFLRQALEPYVFPPLMQSVTAGARSIFLLPKIGNSERYWRMARRHRLPLELPATLFDQWQTFKSLAKNAQSNWHAKVLFFSDTWLNQPGSEQLRAYLSAQIVPTPQLAVHKHQIDAAIDSLIEERTEILSGQILKSILSIAHGDMPGFALAEDETFAPIKLIQRAFIEDYGLKSANMMIPAYIHSGTECFYSFELNNDKSKPNQPSVVLLEETQNLYNRLVEYWEKNSILHKDLLASYFEVKMNFIHAYANDHTLKAIDHGTSPHTPFLRKGAIAMTSMNSLRH